MNKTYTLKKEIKFKDGTIFPANSKICFSSVENSTTLCSIYLEKDPTKSYKIKWLSFVQFCGIKIPSMNQLHKYSDGISKSITGYKVEPDGYGPDGAPSWLIVLGYI